MSTDPDRDRLVDLFKRVILSYFEAKMVIALTERLDPDRQINGLAINELRHALDHLMRVEAVREGLAEELVNREWLSFTPDQGEYQRLHLEKCLGHLYRAAYDANDVIAYAYEREIRGFVLPYANSDLAAVVPGYYSDIRPKLDEIAELVAEAKMLKDVEGAETEPLDSEDPSENEAGLREHDSGINAGDLRSGLRKFENAIIQLKEIRDELRQKQGALAEHRRKRWQNKVVWVLIGALATLIVTAVWTRAFKGSDQAAKPEGALKTHSETELRVPASTDRDAR